MNPSPTALLHGILLLPLLVAMMVVAANRRPNVREGLSLAGGLLVFACVWMLHRAVGAGESLDITWLELMPGLSLRFHAEPLGILFALIAGFLWPVTTLYAVGYMRGHHESNQTRFYAFFAISIAAAMGIAFAANLFTLFVFYEVLTLCTYPLVTHAGTEKAKQGGRTYLGVLLSTSILFFLLAIIGTWAVAGTLEFRRGGVFDDATSPWVLATLLLLFVFGIGKAAIMPLHRWLPAAMVAPTPVSALLHAVAVVKAGVFTIIKVAVFVFGLDQLPAIPATQWLIYLAGASILLASLVAMRQDNLKKRLAYSTVSQLSYVTLGALLASSAAVAGSAMHIAMHAFGKITLFFCAGAILVASHKTEVSQMRGLGRQMPFTMAAFFVGSLSIIGLPPAGGTWSKWYLLWGSMDAGQWLLVTVLLVSSLLNIAYLLPIPLRAFFSRETTTEPVEIREAPLPALLALILTALVCVALFIYPQPLYELATAVP